MISRDIFVILWQSVGKYIYERILTTYKPDALPCSSPTVGAERGYAGQQNSVLRTVF